MSLLTVRLAEAWPAADSGVLKADGCFSDQACVNREDERCSR